MEENVCNKHRKTYPPCEHGHAYDPETKTFYQCYGSEWHGPNYILGDKRTLVRCKKKAPELIGKKKIAGYIVICG